MGRIYAVPSQDFVQKNLDAELTAGITSSIALNNVVGIQNLPGVFVVDRVHPITGVETPDKREVVAFSSTSGSTLVTLTRGLAGTSDQTHAVGAVVEFSPDVIWAQSIYDALGNLVTPSTGAVDLAKVVTPTGTQTLTGKTINRASNTITVTEADLTTSDVTTDNVTAAKHGFVPKFPNNTTTFFRGDGTYAIPPTAGGALSAFSSTAANATFADTFTQVVTVSLTTTVTSKISFNFHGLIAAGSAVAIDTQVQIKEGATVLLGPQQSGGNVGTNVNQFAVGAAYVYNKAAGAYTFSVEMKNSFSSNTVNVGVVNFSVVAVPA